MLVYGALPRLAPNGTARSRKHPCRSPKPKLSVLHLPRRIGLPPGVAYLCQPHPRDAQELEDSVPSRNGIPCMGLSEQLQETVLI